ncbi:hypothetical protein NBH15_04505 [Parabacteroides sp. W1-Q-101]|uniref:hypothetical protein n=1 Tax=Parabacteroides TaxID=375288 RepID=UPI00202E2AD1|nr:MULTISPECIES: hypothetical protein [unclassified Parabacteroides]MCM0717531.1 hypothetical protein [Parabacteroides sp. W1-Q-101]
MHTNFSLQRIKLLLLADKTELFRQYFLSMLSYIAVTITYLMIVKFVFHNEQQVEQKVYFFYRIGLLLFFLFFCRFANQKVHQIKGQYLTIPASSTEKFAVLLTDGILLLLFFHILFYILLYIASFLITEIQALEANKIIGKVPASIYIFIASTFFLGNIAFRKYANPVIVGSYALLIFALGVLARPILRAVREPQGDVYMIETTPLYYLYNFLTQYYGIILYVATLVVLYISYLKLKEKQIR